MGVGTITRAAVFLDRDGVINDNWLNPLTGEWESPIHPGDFHLLPGVIDALGRLQKLGYRLFVVSNQPSAAKGKCTIEDLASVHARMVELMADADVHFDAFYYSYTHPDGVVPGLSGPGLERKPNPYFINLALRTFNLDQSACWMIGDRDTDVLCGKRAGLRTIQVASREGRANAGHANPDFFAVDLAGAVEIIARNPRCSRI